MARTIKILCTLSQLSISTSNTETWLNDGDESKANNKNFLHVPASLSLQGRAESSSFSHSPWTAPAPRLHLHIPRGSAWHLLPDPVHPAQVPNPSRNNEIPHGVLKNLDPCEANLLDQQQFAILRKQEEQGVILSNWQIEWLEERLYSWMLHLTGQVWLQSGVSCLVSR